MSSQTSETPTTGLDYQAEVFVHAETPDQLKALGSQVRMTILDLLNERAASVTELAAALDRPKGTIGYHVKPGGTASNFILTGERGREIASAIVFLATEAPESMTGCIVDVNGASYLRT